MSERVKVERAGAVAILRFDDPSAMNALSAAVKEGLAASGRPLCYPVAIVHS